MILSVAVSAQQLRIIDQAAKAAGIPPEILYGQYGQESGFGSNTGPSSAGAVGPFQFMPATARSVGLKDPYDFKQAAFAAARYIAPYIKQRGIKGGLAAYNAGPNGNPNNAETRNYITQVLRFSKQYPGLGGGKGASTALEAPSGPSDATGAPGAAPDLAGLISLLQGQQKPAPPTSSLAPPSFAAGPKLAGALPPSSGAPKPKQDPTPLLLAVAQAAAANPQQAPSDSMAPLLAPSSGGGGGGELGKVTIAKTADRPGVPISKGVVSFVRRVAGIYGNPLTIGTGSNHSRLTVNGNVSDHWAGNAADVPLAGRALVKAGQDALIAAGWSPKKARQQTGGLYNVETPQGRVQIIFATHIGGDHTNHLHIGIAPKR